MSPGGSCNPAPKSPQECDSALWGSAPAIPSVAASVGCPCPMVKWTSALTAHLSVSLLECSVLGAAPNPLALGLCVCLCQSPCPQGVTGPLCQEGAGAWGCPHSPNGLCKPHLGTPRCRSRLRTFLNHSRSFLPQNSRDLRGTVPEITREQVRVGLGLGPGNKPPPPGGRWMALG